MKNWIKSLFLILFITPVFAQELILPVTGVYDADTINTQLPLPTPLNDVSIRILGIDAPEYPAKSYLETGKLGRAKCIKEAELAINAKNYLVALLSTGSNIMYLTDYDYDKFGGRILANVYILNKFTGKRENVSEILISQKFAVPYDGGKKTYDWCR